MLLSEVFEPQNEEQSYRNNGMLFHYFRFVTAALTFFVGFSITNSMLNTVNLEMHGEYRITLLVGLEMAAYGIGATVGPPFAGLSYIERS